MYYKINKKINNKVAKWSSSFDLIFLTIPNDHALIRSLFQGSSRWPWKWLSSILRKLFIITISSASQSLDLKPYLRCISVVLQNNSFNKLYSFFFSKKDKLLILWEEEIVSLRWFRKAARVDLLCALETVLDRELWRVIELSIGNTTRHRIKVLITRKIIIVIVVVKEVLSWNRHSICTCSCVRRVITKPWERIGQLASRNTSKIELII